MPPPPPPPYGYPYSYMYPPHVPYPPYPYPPPMYMYPPVDGMNPYSHMFQSSNPTPSTVPSSKPQPSFMANPLGQMNNQPIVLELLQERSKVQEEANWTRKKLAETMMMLKDVGYHGNGTTNAVNTQPITVLAVTHAK